MIIISKNEVEKARLRSEYKYQLDLQSKMVYAKRQGMQEGRVEGELAKALAIAQNMITDGEPIDKIMRYTGLTREEVEALHKELK